MAIACATVTAVVATARVVAAAGDCWALPDGAVVVDPFRAPQCPYCAGNRGIEFAVHAGPVRAVASGVVTYAGRVAGTAYVVVALGDGRRVTYGRLASIEVARGARVLRGTTIGTTNGPLLLGVRSGTSYVDPAPSFATQRFPRRLVPITIGARSVSARPTCRGDGIAVGSVAGRR